MTTAEVRESEIENIFAQYPVLLREVLQLSNDIFLVARQKILPSSRLDLVYSHLSELLYDYTMQQSIINIVGLHKSLHRPWAVIVASWPCEEATMAALPCRFNIHMRSSRVRQSTI